MFVLYLLLLCRIMQFFHSWAIKQEGKKNEVKANKKRASSNQEIETWLKEAYLSFCHNDRASGMMIRAYHDVQIVRRYDVEF